MSAQARHAAAHTPTHTGLHSNIFLLALAAPDN